MISGNSDQCEGQTIVYGGAARLPQFANNVSPLLSIEIELDCASQSVVAVHVDPGLTGLKHIIEGAIVGQGAAAIGNVALQAVAKRYHSPFRNAARAALTGAWEAYVHSLGRTAASSSKPPEMLMSLSD